MNCILYFYSGRYQILSVTALYKCVLLFSHGTKQRSSPVVDLFTLIHFPFHFSVCDFHWIHFLDLLSFTHFFFTFAHAEYRNGIIFYNKSYSTFNISYSLINIKVCKIVIDNLSNFHITDISIFYLSYSLKPEMKSITIFGMELCKYYSIQL